MAGGHFRRTALYEKKRNCAMEANGRQANPHPHIGRLLQNCSMQSVDAGHRVGLALNGHNPI
jgi:hypothetical protein